MNVITKEQDFAFRRGVMIEKMNVIACYHRTKELLGKMDMQLRTLSETVSAQSNKNFQNPRQETGFLHDVKTLTVVQRQRERLVQKLEELQCRIKEDIDSTK